MADEVSIEIVNQIVEELGGDRTLAAAFIVARGLMRLCNTLDNMSVSCASGSTAVESIAEKIQKVGDSITESIGRV